MKKAEFDVEGMTCANCALSVTKYLEKQGLNDVRVNLISKDLSFSSSGDIAVEKLKKGLKGFGYEMKEKTLNHVSNKAEAFLKTPLQKFWFCLPFTFLLWLPMFIDIHWLMAPWTQFALCIPVMAVGLNYFGKSAFYSLRNGVPNMNVLITIGSASAFIYSLIATLQLSAHYALYYESAATIITIVLIGYWMEDVSIARTQESLRSLSAEQKTIANMIAFDEDHKEQIFPVSNSDLRPGDLILIKEGESVPTDCKILWGDGFVNESIISGESLPLEKHAKDLLIGGSSLTEGVLKAQVTATGNETVLAKIINLAKQAQSEKAPIQKLADRISAIFVPAVIAIAIITFLVNHYVFHIAADTSLMRSIAVLVISCPCAMGLATPAAIAVGLGKAAKHGILFKDAKSLEQFKNIRQVVFDKTGTLTTGDFVISGFNFSGDEILFKSICYSLEKFSNHPLARTITKEWKGAEVIRWEKVEEIKGLGITAFDKEGNNYSIGSYQSVKHLSPEKDHNIYIRKNNALLGWVDLKDEVRSEAQQVISYFKMNNIKTILLSGDSLDRCRKLKEDLGMDEFYGEQSPQNKMDVISGLVKVLPTAMVGDGINDAAALARATIGIAVSDASHIAIQNAQVILMSNGIKNLPLALRLGRLTYLTIKQNLFWAFFYNILAIPVAALGLLTPGVAAFAMGFSDVVLVANSLRLKWRKTGNFAYHE